MIEVFKTNVRTPKQAGRILTQLSMLYPTAKINFDLSDCDKVLRVEGQQIPSGEIIAYLKRQSFQCEALP
jgi:hypothetical protein